MFEYYIKSTCGHGEEYQYTCSYNEAHIKTEYEGDINPSNHDYEFVETITPATCVAKAKNKYICKDNPSHIDERVEGELNPNNHDKEEVDRVNANCTEGGHIDYICKDCGEEIIENIAPLGHDWDEGVITKQPTKTEKGEKTYTCKVCGQTRIEEIPALGNMDEAEQPVVPKESPNANVGAIVGGAVGGSTGLIILIIVVIKKKKKI